MIRDEEEARKASVLRRHLSRVRELERRRRGWEGISINEERELSRLRAMLSEAASIGATPGAPVSPADHWDWNRPRTTILGPD
ncbi:MAG: hypothetical protein MUF07_06500 [Steroidobacteraceae bacterium]|jgi:hypothetical protein|nr:hypothetical protein [Steroidobacteraceae bacterium]